MNQSLWMLLRVLVASIYFKINFTQTLSNINDFLEVIKSTGAKYILRKGNQQLFETGRVLWSVGGRCLMNQSNNKKELTIISTF